MALSGSNPSAESAVDQESATEQNEATAPVVDYPTKPEEYEQACQGGQTREDSDLCAQWTAAVVAEEASDFAGTANDIALVSAILSFVSVVLVIIALCQTQRSLKSAEADRATANTEAAKQAVGAASALAQATRGAEAMSNVAATLERQSEIAAKTAETSRQIVEAQKMTLRAFVTVKVEDAVYQVRDMDVEFRAWPKLWNGGQTSAKNLRYATTAAILPDPLPEGFEFDWPEPEGEGGFIPPQDGRRVVSPLGRFIDEGRVENVLRQAGEGFYVWGRVYYEDVFGKQRQTDFGARLTWTRDFSGNTNVETIYIPGMNDAT